MLWVKATATTAGRPLVAVVRQGLVEATWKSSRHKPPEAELLLKSEQLKDLVSEDLETAHMSQGHYSFTGGKGTSGRFYLQVNFPTVSK